MLVLELLVLELLVLELLVLVALTLVHSLAGVQALVYMPVPVL